MTSKFAYCLYTFAKGLNGVIFTMWGEGEGVRPPSILSLMVSLPPANTHGWSLFLYYVCVCVCVREREFVCVRCVFTLLKLNVCIHTSHTHKQLYVSLLLSLTLSHTHTHTHASNSVKPKMPADLRDVLHLHMRPY